VRVHSVPCSRHVHSVRGALASQCLRNAQRLVDRQAQRVGAVVCGGCEVESDKAARIAWKKHATTF
jgi:hypothetical protein